MSTALEREIEADCSVLLIRSLLSQKVSAFGEDGLGKHGKNDRAMFYKIEDIDLDIIVDDTGEPFGTVCLKLEGYDSNQFGHIFTDQNFMIAIQALLKDHHIDPSSLEYSDLCLQGDDYVSLDINIPNLLDWV